MKTILSLFVFLLLGNYTVAQTTCCHKKEAVAQFSSFSEDKDFVSSHLEPLAFTLEAPIGKMIQFAAKSGKQANAYEIKAEKPTDKYVLVFHEWWGLNDYIKKESEKIFQTLGNVNVLAIDLYDGKVAATRDSAGKYMQETKTERAGAIIEGALGYMGKQAKISSIGWCFGGGWSMQAALIAGAQSKTCVIYYGMPEENEEKLKKLTAPVLFVWPENDQWINKEVVNKFEANMKALNKTVDILKYQADHAFANPSNPKYAKELAEDAFGKAMEFIRRGFM